MTERNVIEATATTYLAMFTDFIDPLKWLVLLALALVVADLKFGIEAARARSENIRVSRAVRRSTF